MHAGRLRAARELHPFADGLLGEPVAAAQESRAVEQDRLKAMAAVLLPYVELLLFLAGTVLYGFLLRELLRRPDVPAGGLLRLLAGALLLWYAGTLFDQWLVFLAGPLRGASTAAALLDVARGLGWLLALPILLHVLADLARMELGPSRIRRALVLIGYASLLLFVGPIRAVVASRSPFLVEATAAFYPRLVLHAAICLLPAAWIAWRLAGSLGADPRMARFLRALCRLLVLLVVLFALGLSTGDVWSADPGAWGAALRLSILAALLLPGGLFAYFVQRYNLLRLSLSNRFLRQLGTVLIVVLLAMLAGPAMGAASAAAFRPFVAWGLVLALAWSLCTSLALPYLVERSAAWRVLFGRAVTAPRLEGLMERLESLDADDDQLMRETAGAISQWLGCGAELVPRTLATEGLWRAVETAGRVDAHRLSKLPPELSRQLDRHDLQAVFALRVRGELLGLLGLSASVTGGGHDEDELEGVRLVLRQLESSLLLRRLSRERVAEERRAAEQERLGLLGLVSASLAHEIKNPLSSIKVLAQALREEMLAADPESEAALDLDAIVEQIDRLDVTAREILGFARPRRGQSTDLEALLSSAVYVLSAEAKKRSIVIKSEIWALPAEVVGSPAAWQTIGFNLLHNAVGHAPRGGVVGVALGRRGELAVIEVSNPGRLDAEVRSQLFEPFASGSESTGLGLALVANRVEQLGAGIDVTEEDGRVIFRVEAPLACAGELPAVPPSEDRAGDEAGTADPYTADPYRRMERA